MCVCVCVCVCVYAYACICTANIYSGKHTQSYALPIPNHKTRLKNIRDVEIPEKQKARKQGRDDSIKAVQYIQPHPIYLSH